MGKEPKIKIFVAHHKPGYIYEDDVYVPIQVGKKNAEVDLGIIGDDTGDNISEKNDNYAELTAQYWVRKNYDLRDVDYVGFCHYRRYMAYNFKYNPLKIRNNYNTNHVRYTKIIQAIKYVFGLDIAKSITNYENIIKTSSISIKNILKKYHYDIILTKRVPIRPMHQLGLCDESLRKILYNVIINNYPDYKKTIENIDGMILRNGCNMGILKKEIFIEYDEWLFNILFKFEDIINKENKRALCFKEPMTAGTRFMGCLGERLFNLFLYHKKLQGVKIAHKFNMIGFKDV